MLEFVEEKKMTEQLFMMMTKDKIFISRILEPASTFSVSVSMAEEALKGHPAGKLISTMISFCDKKS